MPTPPSHALISSTLRKKFLILPIGLQRFRSGPFNYEDAPLNVSAHGSKRVNPRKKRSERVVTLLTQGDPRVAPASSPLAKSRVATASPDGGGGGRSPPEYVLAVSSPALEPFFSPPRGQTAMAAAEPRGFLSLRRHLVLLPPSSSAAPSVR
jgi:hypothetical protein